MDDYQQNDQIRASVDNFRASKEPDETNFFREFVNKIEEKHQTNEEPVFDFYSFPLKQKKEYAKYDDNAFKRDLERY